VFAAFSRTPWGTPRAEAGIHRRPASLDILRGASADISLVTSYLTPPSSTPCFLATIAIVVAMQVM